MKQRISITNDTKVRLWYMATCNECVPFLGTPFRSEKERDDWNEIHGQETGHSIRCHTEIVITSP